MSYNFSAETQLQATALNSTYIESVLKHRMIADLSSELWRRNCLATFQVFNAEVDNAGFDIVLKLGRHIRYVQLKQSHAEKAVSHCSVRLSFSELPGSCVVLMSYRLTDLSIAQYRYYGTTPQGPMPPIREFRASIAPGRRNAEGKRHVRHHYRNVPANRFLRCADASALYQSLFPGDIEQLISGNDQLPGFEDDDQNQTFD